MNPESRAGTESKEQAMTRNAKRRAKEPLPMPKHGLAQCCAALAGRVVNGGSDIPVFHWP